MTTDTALRIVLGVREGEEMRRLREDNRRLSDVHLWRAYHFQETMRRFAEKKLSYVNSKISLPPLNVQTLIHVRYDDNTKLYVDPNLTDESCILQEGSPLVPLSDMDSLARFAERSPVQFEYFLNFRGKWIDLDTPCTGVLFMDNL